MNKSILIQYKNIPETVKEQFSADSIIDFDYSNRDKEIKSLDEYITKYIIEQLKDKEFNVVYIKDNLSSNYLELYGLRVAYHIRLSQELDNQRYVPIVILSDLDGYTLNKLEPMAKIIFTKNIFLESNSKNTIEIFNNRTIKPLGKKEYKSKFLDLIEIVSPENSTNHSIANEWAVFKWANMLEVPKQDIAKIITNVFNNLYFKYLQNLYPNKNSFDDLNKEDMELIHKLKSIKKANILYVDDEHNQGLELIINRLYAAFNDNINFYSLNFSDIKDKQNYDQIEHEVEEKIVSYEGVVPDIVVLDMRLIDKDHNKEISPQEISGIKLINHIKTNLNAGIQIIIITASGRVDILDEASKRNNIVGYIKKEHPSDIFSNTKDNIMNFIKYTTNSSDKFYLKDIWDIQVKILKIGNLDKDIIFEINLVFEILNSNIEKSFVFAMITIFKPLEILKNNHTYDKKVILIFKNEIISVDQKEFLDNYKQYNFNNHRNALNHSSSIKNKVWSFLFHKYDYKNIDVYRDIEKIAKYRNDAMHNDFDYSLIDSSLIVNWFNMLEKILYEIYKQK